MRLSIGGMSKIDIHNEICQKLNIMYEAKNRDYGDSFAKLRREYGNPAILIRLEDKLGRLKRLMLSGERNVKTESIEDTLMDMANYAIMELIERQIEQESEGKPIYYEEQSESIYTGRY